MGTRPETSRCKGEQMYEIRVPRLDNQDWDRVVEQMESRGHKYDVDHMLIHDGHWYAVGIRCMNHRAAMVALALIG